MNAFLLTRQWKDTHQGICLEFWFRSDENAFKVEVPKQYAVFFIQQKDVSQAQNLLNKIPDYHIKPLALKTFDYEKVSCVYFLSQEKLYRARDLLEKNGVRIFESDIRPTERYLTERFITSAANINLNVPSNPKLSKTDYYPSLRIFSLDIETDYATDEIFSISFVSKIKNLTLMIGSGKNSEKLYFVKDEVELLHQFIKWINVIDPDVFIGWNVINFDFRFLQRKADQLNIALAIGRDKSIPIWRKVKEESEQYFLLIPGRVVLDGIDTLKSATYSFQSFALDAVGKSLLNRGKLIQNDKEKRDPLYKAKEIRRQFYEDKTALAKYNLEDCQLVWDIFKKTNLIDFAIERATLTGLELDRFGGSVAAFDNLYLPRLHRKGFVAPNIGDNPGQLTAPGGYVMDSQPGFYDSVLVLDYKSLYPSIIRTFKVDPYGQVAALNQNSENTILGFDGAVFSKTEFILPDIIKQLWQARDRAKKEKNTALSQAIKIIMSSFYGVLGSEGCRVHDSRLTSSITKRSHEIIIQSVKLIQNQGYTVIYGDTDSVFISIGRSLTRKQASDIGGGLVATINQYWIEELSQRYGITSYLEMEYETHFVKFFMPTIRGSEKGSKKRYAGMIEKENNETEIIFKGLEAVRSDWTALAREFQQDLYERIFNNLSFEDYIINTVNELNSGARDHQLVYKKRLRQKLSEYIKNIPPHAQAALKAEKILRKNAVPARYQNSRWVEYVMTVNGAETIACQQSPLDYEHYIEKQLVPIGDAILSVVGESTASILSRQIDMFKL